jgi:hypothetical protein
VEPPQVQIDFSLDALQRHGLDGGAVVQRLEASNRSLAAGQLKRGDESWPLRVVNQFASLDDIGALPIDHNGLRLRDVAAISYREPDLDYGRHLDKTRAIGLNVIKESGSNTVDVARRSRAALVEIARDPELTGVRVLTFTDQGEEITNSIRGLLESGLIGGFLAVLVLLFFLRNVITTLVVAAFLASAIGGVLSGGASIAGSVASGATQAAAAAAPAITDVARDSNTGYFVDSLFRSTASPASTTPASPDGSARDAQAEAAKIFAHSIASGSLSPADKQYLGQVVAARTGLAQAEAEQRVDAAYTSMNQSIEAAKAKAKEAADQTRKVTAGLSLWMFISLLCGAFFGSLAATFGGRRRDL